MAIRILAGTALLLLLLASPMACTATIVPPPAPADPVDIFVVVQRLTSSLVLPSPRSELVRYAYGDWRYYALAENTALNGLAALAWPTQGALGRGVLPADADAERVRALTAADAVHALRVERGDAMRLVARLDAAHAAHRHTEVDNRPYGLRFVHREPRYTYFYNSNHAVAGWLRQLGCDVRGPTFTSRWRVRAVD